MIRIPFVICKTLCKEHQTKSKCFSSFCSHPTLRLQIHKYTIPNTRNPTLPSKKSLWFESLLLFAKHCAKTPNQIQTFFIPLFPTQRSHFHCKLFGLRRVTWYSCVVYSLYSLPYRGGPFQKKAWEGCAVHDASPLCAWHFLHGGVSWLVLCTHKDMNGLSLAFSTLSRWIVFDMRSSPASMHCTVTAASTSEISEGL
jgi:hypothetical protein